MNRKKHWLWVSVILALAYSASYLVLIWLSPLPYRLMDFNGDGSVSLLEAFSALDVATRTIPVEGDDCMEYYFMKDGVGIAVACQ